MARDLVERMGSITQPCAQGSHDGTMGRNVVFTGRSRWRSAIKNRSIIKELINY